MREHRLLMNETKTEFLLIGTKQQLAKFDINHVRVGDADIVPHFPIKNLGVWFDSNLSMKEHITEASSAAFFHLYNIRRIRKYLSRDDTETLFHLVLVASIIVTASYGTPICHLHKLQRVQKAAARLVYQESKHCHITPILNHFTGCQLIIG